MDRYKVVRIADQDFDDYYTYDIEDLKEIDDEGFPNVVATVYDRAFAKEITTFLNKKRSK
jgi:hypothetical protein